MNRYVTTFIVILIFILICVGAYWYFFVHHASSVAVTSTPTAPLQNGFAPLNSMPITRYNAGQTNISTSSAPIVNNQSVPTSPIPTLRLLSNTPVGGYGAYSTATTTFVRWIDRGRGNIYQVDESLLGEQTLSNTLLPMVYESSWNQDLSAFVGGMFENGNVNFLYAALMPQANSTVMSTSTASTTNQVTLTPFELRGGNLPSGTIAYAVSPDGKKTFFMTDESGTGVGYVANFNGTGVTRIFSTPLLQVNVDWPEINTIAIETKGSATQNGYLYFVNPQTGAWKEVLGPIVGMSVKVSHDAKYVIVSATGNNNDIVTDIYAVATGTATDAVIRTLADKCAWGNFYKDIVYCAVPAVPMPATYPDDWYKGTVSLNDKIWQVNAVTGEVHLISSIVDQSDRVIDGFNLDLDNADKYLFFMNKNDLSLWSLNLVSSN